MNSYILDENNEPQSCDMIDWVCWIETADRHVAKTEVPDGEVSTVFLGLDHGFGMKGPPVLWETMVFGGTLDGEQERYTSHADAVAGHERIVDRCRKAAP